MNVKRRTIPLHQCVRHHFFAASCSFVVRGTPRIARDINEHVRAFEDPRGNTPLSSSPTRSNCYQLELASSVPVWKSTEAFRGERSRAGGSWRERWMVLWIWMRVVKPCLSSLLSVSSKFTKKVCTAATLLTGEHRYLSARWPFSEAVAAGC